jgi:hypothetical protein
LVMNGGFLEQLGCCDRRRMGLSGHEEGTAGWFAVTRE